MRRGEVSSASSTSAGFRCSSMTSPHSEASRRSPTRHGLPTHRRASHRHRPCLQLLRQCVRDSAGPHGRRARRHRFDSGPRAVPHAGAKASAASVCRFADCVLVNAEAVKTWLISERYDPSNIVVIRNGVDIRPSGWRPHRERLLNELGLSQASPLVGVVSRLSRLKGLEAFLEAAAILAARFPAVRFLVVGETSPDDRAYRTELIGLARSLAWSIAWCSPACERTCANSSPASRCP